MSRTIRRVTLGVAAALSLTATLLVAPPAPEATARVTGPGICGPPYKFIDKGRIGGTKKGRVVLSKHRRSDTLCVVTISTHTGHEKRMGAEIGRKNPGRHKQDYGRYRTYAGPVYLSRKGGCISGKGYIEKAGVGYTRNVC